MRLLRLLGFVKKYQYLHVPSGRIYISKDVVFDESSFPFQSSLSSLSPPTPTLSPQIPISTSLLPSIVPVLSSSAGLTIDSSPPPPPPPYILLLHHLHQCPPMSPFHHSHPQTLPVPLLSGPIIWSPEHRITPEYQRSGHPVSHAYLSHGRLGHHFCQTHIFHASF